MAETVYVNPVLPGFEKYAQQTDPDSLALLPVGKDDLVEFMGIEDSLERPMEVQETRGHLQAAADGYVDAAKAYQGQGFYIKAASLKARAAYFYAESGDYVTAGLELVDAVDLDIQTDRFAKLIVAINDHEPMVPIRANYPNLFLNCGYERGEAEDGHCSSSYVIFYMLKAHYNLLIRILSRNPKSTAATKTHRLAQADLYDIKPELARELEWQHRLLDWNEDRETIAYRL